MHAFVFVFNSARCYSAGDTFYGQCQCEMKSFLFSSSVCFPTVKTTSLFFFTLFLNVHSECARTEAEGWEGRVWLQRAKESLHRPEHGSKKAQDLGHPAKRRGGMGGLGWKKRGPERRGGERWHRYEDGETRRARWGEEWRAARHVISGHVTGKEKGTAGRKIYK